MIVNKNEVEKVKDSNENIELEQKNKDALGNIELLANDMVANENPEMILVLGVDRHIYVGIFKASDYSDLGKEIANVMGNWVYSYQDEDGETKESNIMFKDVRKHDGSAFVATSIMDDNYIITNAKDYIC